MSFTHREVAQRFVKGKRATGHNMFTRDKVIYSFGKHFPIALDLGHDMYLFNNDHYSSQTTTHQWIVRGALVGFETCDCTTEEIKKAIRNPGEPIVTVRLKEHDTLEGTLANIYSICKREGMTRVPLKKWLDMITEEKDMSVFRRNAKSRDNYLRHRATDLASKLLDSKRYGKECFKTLLSLFKDLNVFVIKGACNTLSNRLHVMDNTTLTRVEEVFRSIDHEDFPLEYLGLMQLEYFNDRQKAVAALFLGEDGVKYLRVGGERWERNSLTSLKVKQLEEDWMHVGEYEYMTVTSTIPPEVLENMLALFTLCDL